MYIMSEHLRNYDTANNCLHVSSKVLLHPDLKKYVLETKNSADKIVQLSIHTSGVCHPVL